MPPPAEMPTSPYQRLSSERVTVPRTSPLLAIFLPPEVTTSVAA